MPPFWERSSQDHKLDPRLWLLRHYEFVGLWTRKQREAMHWNGEGRVLPHFLAAATLPDFYRELDAVHARYVQALPALEAQWACDRVRQRNSARVRLARAMFQAACARHVAAGVRKRTLPSIDVLRAVVDETKAAARPERGECDLVLFSRELLQCSFWNPLRTRDNPVVLLLSKSLPQPCQIREIADATLDDMARHPWFAVECRKWGRAAPIAPCSFLFFIQMDRLLFARPLYALRVVAQCQAHD